MNNYSDLRANAMEFLHAIEWQLTKRQLEAIYDWLDEVGELVGGEEVHGA